MCGASQGGIFYRDLRRRATRSTFPLRGGPSRLVREACGVRVNFQSILVEVYAALRRIIARELDQLRAGQARLHELVLTYHLSRDPEEYLIFYNCRRPHFALNQLSPMQHLLANGVMSKKSVTCTAHFVSGF